MKLFIIGSLLFSGGGVAAMQNETVNEEVTEKVAQVRQYVQNRFKRELYSEVQETGFPYPSEEYLASLTEEQALAVVSEIDLINATYDWPNMTDDEVKEALLVAKEQLVTLFEELEIDGPVQYALEAKRAEKIEELKVNGLQYPEKLLEYLTDEQVQAVTEKIDELNATYDWATMTDEEIDAALDVVKAEMEALRTDLGIEAPVRENFRDRIKEGFQKSFRKGYKKGFENGFEKGFKRGQQSPTEDLPVEDTTDGDTA